MPYPQLVTRPALLLPAVAGPDLGAASVIALDAGVPARIQLDTARTLVLGVPLGQARRFLSLDPSTIVVNGGTAGAAAAERDPDDPAPRLSLIAGGVLGDTVALQPGVTVTLCARGATSVRIVVDALVLTAGSLCGAGPYGSSISLRWQDAATAPDSGPPGASGDPSIPVQRPRFTLARFGKQVQR